jgi:hypothetical protein
MKSLLEKIYILTQILTAYVQTIKSNPQIWYSGRGTGKYHTTNLIFKEGANVG